MPLKRYKVSLEFVLDVDELTDERATETVRHYLNFAEIVRSPEHWQHVDRQRRLLAALLSDEEVLREYVRNEAASLAELGMEQISERLGDIDRDQEILAPVVAQLPEEDVEAFETAIANGVFSENTEEFSECFSLNLRRATIDEIVYDEG